MFIWLSGADTEALTLSSIAEQRKYIKLGIVVFIPAVMAWAGMWFAGPYIGIVGWSRVATATIWSLIILSVDTYLVSTLDKRILVDNRKNYLLLAGFRIAISIFLGIIISHPLVLKVLEGSINEEIESMRIEKTNEILAINRDSAISWNKANLQAINSIETIVKCKEDLLKAEGNGEKIQTDCGSSSGNPNKGFRYRKLEEEIAYLRFRQDSIRATIKTVYAYFRSKAAKDSAQIQRAFSNDYLKRISALRKIKEKDKMNGEWISHTSIMVWLLLIFLILLDSIAVLSKILSPSGQYESMLTRHETHLDYRERIRALNTNQIEEATLDYRLQMIRAIYSRAPHHEPDAVRMAIDAVLGTASTRPNAPQPITDDRRRTIKQIVFLAASTILGIVLWLILKQPVFNIKNEDIQIAMAIYLAAISIYGGFLK